MNRDTQTEPSDRSVTIAFRTSEQVKHLVRAAAARRDEFPSEWLRRAVRAALQDELEEPVDSPISEGG